MGPELTVLDFRQRVLLKEQWRSIDAGEGRLSWAEVMQRTGKTVMLV